MTKRARIVGSGEMYGRNALHDRSQRPTRTVAKAHTNGRIAPHEYTSRPTRIIVFANTLSHIPHTWNVFRVFMISVATVM